MRLPSYGMSPSPSSSGSDSPSDSDSGDGDATAAAHWLPRRPPHAPTEEECDDPLDQSGVFEGDVRAEMDELLAQADARAAAPWERHQQQQQQQQHAPTQDAAALNDSVFADSDGDVEHVDDNDGDVDGDGDVDPAALAANAELQQKISAERKMLGDLISQLTALQSQAAQLKQLSLMSHDAQSDMEQVLRETRRHAHTDLSEGDDASASADEEEEQDQASANNNNSNNWAAQAAQPYSTASPSDSDIEVEIERQPSANARSAAAVQSQPAWSDDEEELSADAQQLAELEDLMAALSREAEAHKAAYDSEMRAQAQTQGQGRARDLNRSGSSQRGGRVSAAANGRDQEDEADEEERMEKARRNASMRSPLTSASPSPPRVRERSRPSQQQARAAAASASFAASSHQSPPSPTARTIARLPAHAVPPVPIARWIGPSALPTALAGGGSGSHAQYADRPATAVGTARSVVQRSNSLNGASRSQTSQTSSSNNSRSSSGDGTDGVAWAAPTLSSLPRPRTHKAASVSSKGSMFVNAPESVSGDRDRANARARVAYGEHRSAGAGGIVEDSEEDAYSAIDDLADSDDALLDNDDDDDQGDFEAEEDQRILASIDQDHPDRESYAAVMAALQQQQRPSGQRSSRRQAWDASASPEPSDSDADLPYTINAGAGAGGGASASGRPKTARTAASTNLNGFAPPSGRFASSYAPSDSDEEAQQYRPQAQRAQPARQSSRAAQTQSSQTPFNPSRLSASDLQSVLAFIGSELFRSTVAVGNTGAAARGLGAGRLGAGASYHDREQTQQQQQQYQQRPQPAPQGRTARGYGFQPAQPAREWRPSSHSFAQ